MHPALGCSAFVYLQDSAPVLCTELLDSLLGMPVELCDITVEQACTARCTLSEQVSEGGRGTRSRGGVFRLSVKGVETISNNAVLCKARQAGIQLSCITLKLVPYAFAAEVGIKLVCNFSSPRPRMILPFPPLFDQSQVTGAACKFFTARTLLHTA